MISANLSAVFYLISGILFMLALRGLSSPDSSRQGNYFGIAGMIIAIVTTFLSVGNFSNSLIYIIIFLTSYLLSSVAVSFLPKEPVPPVIKIDLFFILFNLKQITHFLKLSIFLLYQQLI